MQKIIQQSVVLLSVCLVYISSTYADISDIKLFGGVSLNQKFMELSVRDRNFSPAFTSLGLSLTASAAQYSLTFNFDESIKDDIEGDGSGLIFYARHDTSLAINYFITNRMRVYAGYREGETESFYTVSNDAFGTSEKGFFAGVGYSYGFADKGTFSATLAFALLEGETSLREPFVNTSAFVVELPPSDVIVGDALGYSLGLAWTSPINPRTRYTLGLMLHQYNFADQQVFSGLDLSYDLDFTTYSISLNHQF